MKRLRVLAAACALGLPAGVALAQPAAAPQPGAVPQPEAGVAVAARPRVALVLSGGGARGFAHIGVLRVLRDMRVPVDIVVGTSMGSVIGGAYAAGSSVADLEQMARHTDWDRVVADRPAREDLEFRRREEDVLLPSRIEFGLHRDGISLPPAAAGNAALELALARLLPAGTRDRPVNQLSLPFRSVASDLVTGDLVDLVDTPLFLTMRASLAVPGVFAPVRVNQRLVVDGGLVRNLPIDLARKMGADIIIAVNVGTPLAPEKNLGSALGVAQQMINILTEQNVQRSIRELGPGDVLISPELSGTSFLDFRNIDSAIKGGEAATRALAPRLAALALPAAEYALFENNRLATPPLSDTPMLLTEVKVESSGRINPKILQVQSGLAQGQTRTRDQVRRAANSLYGRGDLERVEIDIDDEGGQRAVAIRATEASWTNSRLRVGLELASDFDDANRFALKVMHVRSSMNPWGGELRTTAQIGDERGIGVQFHQPLGPGSPWYVAPALQYGSTSLDFFSEGRRKVRYAYSQRSVSLVVGRELGTWGDVQFGIVKQRLGARALIPEDGAGEHASNRYQYFRYRVDTLDSLGFPSRGYLVDAKLSGTGVGADGAAPLAQFSLLGLSAFRTRDWAGHVYGEYAVASSGAAPLSLGGFLRLSGSMPESLEGNRIAFWRLVMARRIGALPVTLGGTLRAGFSLEAGGAFDRRQIVQGDTAAFKQAVSGFLSVETRFGPVYAGAGKTVHGGSTAYLFLGPIW
ncbi:patatin-like phospholipase family protein [Massilia sp. CCM 8734]|uniref:patatin-like phospholipase family protein n=1 Tax=Massilia sp. CCM 8734 TaxID=2609283 RepID=UPI0014237389|nr:patatin-like phospholipase family protein [Massilia sp. CCM 8734]NHZ97427.1 patatin domain-containing protein [Massilia sp. CCM 8734]